MFAIQIVTVPLKFSILKSKDRSMGVRRIFFQGPKRAFINDITHIMTFFDPRPPPFCHAKLTVLITSLRIVSHKYLPPYLRDIILNAP